MKTNACQAVVFDLDGVITATARTHFVAWKETFDEFLQSRADLPEVMRREFTHGDDYIPYVDGKPRYDGVASFLASRGVELPWGDPSDDPGQATVCGVGNRKNQRFREVVARDGVDVLDGSVDLVKGLREKGIRVAVASSSKNAGFILAQTGFLDLFETVVDGNTSAELGLSGKPAPDIFLTAAERLSADPQRSAMVEDAYSGVEAGKRGNFGLVIGIGSGEHAQALKERGAHIVVGGLGELSVEDIQQWFISS